MRKNLLRKDLLRKTREKYFSIGKLIFMCMVEVGTDIELDRMSISILETLDDHSGTATTTEIKNVLGHESTRMLNYRKDRYLEPMELIDTFQPDEGEGTGLPAQEWSLTEKGIELLAEIEDTGERRDLGERVQMMEKKVNSLQEDFQSLNPESDTGAESDMPEVQEELSELREEIEELKQGLVVSQKMESQLNSTMVMASAAKEILIEEHGEERVSALFEERGAELDLIGGTPLLEASPEQ